ERRRGGGGGSRRVGAGSALPRGVRRRGGPGARTHARAGGAVPPARQSGRPPPRAKDGNRRRGWRGPRGRRDGPRAPRRDRGAGGGTPVGHGGHRRQGAVDATCLPAAVRGACAQAPVGLRIVRQATVAYATICPKPGVAPVRAYAVKEFGTPGSIQELPIPEPEPGQVRVHVKAAGVNPAD